MLLKRHWIHQRSAVQLRQVKSRAREIHRHSNLLSHLEHDSDDVLPLLLGDVDDEPRPEVVQDRHGD